MRSQNKARILVTPGAPGTTQAGAHGGLNTAQANSQQPTGTPDTLDLLSSHETPPDGPQRTTVTDGATLGQPRVHGEECGSMLAESKTAGD